MKKTEVVLAGANDGRVAFEKLSNLDVNQKEYRELMDTSNWSIDDGNGKRTQVCEYAKRAAMLTADDGKLLNSQKETYYAEFVRNFVRAFYDAFGEQPEVKKAHTMKCIGWALTRLLETSQKKVDGLTSKLALNPWQALSWGAEEAMDGAAGLRVHENAVAVMAHAKADGQDELEALRTWVNREALSQARRPSRSTNQGSNMLEQAYVSALADLAQEVGRL
jgi:hypothetical protein